jgi:small nuclear ribonucleoprotein (snRNP)-like protein
MEGLEVVVELKTGRRIQGILVFAEDDMNITLKLSPVPSMPSSLSSSSTQKEQTHQLEDQQNNEAKRAGLKVPMGAKSNDQEKETAIFDVRSGGFLDDFTDDDMSENPIARSSSSSAAAGASGAINNNNNTVHIRGSSIRYIQFPDNINPSLDTLVSVGMERERLAKQKYQKTMKR